MTVRTRFAPSPTGYLHIGGVRTALFSWLYARHHRGTFILRVEDTDRERSTPEAIEVILDGLKWLDLGWDEGPFYQTQRMERYRATLERLMHEGSAYHCYCSPAELEVMRAEAMKRGEKPRYDGRCRTRTGPAPAGVKPVVRFKNPQEGEVVIEDLVQGRVVYSNRELDDLILARGDGTPTYNFTVVVDDIDMRITHVIRGDDHLNNTPRQMNIMRALGAEPPRYGHLPLILAPDGKKLSKRHGTVAVTQYRDDGYLPEALLNYLVRLGWSHGDQEIFSREEMVAAFDVANVNRSAAAINPEKLLWLNQHYLREGDDQRLARLLEPHLRSLKLDPASGPSLAALVAVQKLRTRTLREMAEQSRFFYADFEHYESGAADKHLRPEIREPLAKLSQRLAALDSWNKVSLHAALQSVADECGLKIGKVAQPVRIAVTGTTVSPAIDDTLELLDKPRTLERLQRALRYIEERPST